MSHERTLVAKNLPIHCRRSAVLRLKSERFVPSSVTSLTCCFKFWNRRTVALVRLAAMRDFAQRTSALGRTNTRHNASKPTP